MEHSTLHLITEDGVLEILVTTFRPEELGFEDEPLEEEPEGLDLFHPDYLVYEN
jgi:hypothetical protein